MVGITGRRGELLDAMAVESPGQIIVRVFDASKTDYVAGHLDNLAAELGGLDLLIISAGFGEENEAMDLALEKEMIAINVSGFTAVATWAFSYFRLQGRGHLAAITSVAGMRGSGRAAGYSATKAFQINYLEGLRQNACKHKQAITITDIRPGFVETKMAKSSVQFWVAPVEKAADQIFHSLNKRKKVVYITRRWKLIGWLLKAIPSRIYERL